MTEDVVFLLCGAAVLIVLIVCDTALVLTDKLTIRRGYRYGLPEWQVTTREEIRTEEEDD